MGRRAAEHCPPDVACCCNHKHIATVAPSTRLPKKERKKRIKVGSRIVRKNGFCEGWGRGVKNDHNALCMCMELIPIILIKKKI